MSKKSILIFAMLFAFSSTLWAAKPSADEALTKLKAGNARFVEGKTENPHSDAARLQQAGKENQSAHAFATVITCSDSRLPVERIFDAGIMDIFVVRVAGNVCDTDETGSIEYGLAHVNTPLLVVMGHSQCGAVTAVVQHAQGKGHQLESNIPPLIDNIEPAVHRAITAHGSARQEELIDFAIEENVWQSVEDLFARSSATRELVKSGKAKVVGAVYDVGTGKINWLPGSKVAAILKKSEESAPAATAVAEHAPAAAGHQTEHAVATAVENSPHASSGEAFVANVENFNLIDKNKLDTLDKDRKRTNTETKVNLADDSNKSNFILIFILSVVGLAIVMGLISRTSLFANMTVGPKLYCGFGLVVILALLIGGGGYYFLSAVSDKSEQEICAYDMGLKANEMETLLNEYVLVGVKDKAEGQEILKHHAELLKAYKDDIEKFAQTDLDNASKGALAEIRKETAGYEKVFDELLKQYEDVETEKARMEQTAGDMEKELKEYQGEQIKLVEELESSGKASPQELAFQTKVLEIINEIEVASLEIAKNEGDFMVDKKIVNVNEMSAGFGKLQANLRLLKKMLGSSSYNKNETAKHLAMLDNLAKEADEYKNDMAKMVEESLAIEKDLLECQKEVTGVTSNCMALAEHNKKLSDETKRNANNSALLLMGFALVIGSLLSFFITRGITKPLNRIIEGMSEGSSQVAAASEQVSSAGQSLAEGATEQAASLEETSSALEEMSSMTKQNADNAKTANTLAATARDAADDGNRAMNEMLGAMKSINDSSGQISKIIKVIEEIAFQTNLLALNAAVEAARAGDAGKGFAVVADEVRNLAQRAAAAAKDTTSLIEDSVGRTAKGQEIANKSSEALKNIVINVKKVADLVGEIAAASQEQSQGIDQVNVAVAQMDKVTQATAANAEESASASEELSAQAVNLQEMVQELVKMVGNKVTTGTVHKVMTHTPPKVAHTQTHPASTKQNNENGGGNGNKHGLRLAHDTRHDLQSGTKQHKPEDVIPLNDDFKGF